jgi:hypothetical protein
MIQETQISIDVYCEPFTLPQAYRLYVDEHLLTERTYVWQNPEQFVREHIVVHLEPGTHEIRIEPISPGFTGFRYKNFHLNKKLAGTVNNRFVIV